MGPSPGGPGWHSGKAMDFQAEGPGFDPQCHNQGFLKIKILESALYGFQAVCPWERHITPISYSFGREYKPRSSLCVACIPSSTDYKDPDAVDHEGSQCRLQQHTQHAPKVLSPGWRCSVATLH